MQAVREGSSAPASSSPPPMIPSRGSSALFQTVPSSRARLAASDSRCPTCARPAPTSVLREARRAVSFRCSGCLTPQHATSIRAAASGAAPSRCTWSLGMRTCSTFCSSNAITARKRPELAISSTPFGSQTSSCGAWRLGATGPCSVLPRRQGSWTCMGRSSRVPTRLTRGRAGRQLWFQHRLSGLRSSSHRWRRARRTCYIKTHATPSLTSATWARYADPTCAPK
mmetsp:Transcript_5879/g.19465  ORF Transcript_5879/g.19465 Transcript_5879/m.19465 type:complete len:226 (+) Transcript_5879:637-1314(+)